MNPEFLRGWIAATNHSEDTAREQWDWFTRQLPDDERELIESDGFNSGFTMGTEFLKIHPN